MGREDFEPEDIDYYFEYTGSLAVSKEREREAEREKERRKGRLGAASRTYLFRTLSTRPLTARSPFHTLNQRRPRATTIAWTS